MNDELALIDSNLLSYVFDKSEPKKRIICGELVAECWKGKRKYAIWNSLLGCFDCHNDEGK